MNRTSRNDKNNHRNRSSAPRNNTPKKQTGGFQVFNLKEVRAEEKEVEQRVRALEREQEERKAEALKRKLEQMESSYNKNLEVVRKTSDRPVFLEKAALVSAPETTRVSEKPQRKEKPVSEKRVTPVAKAQPSEAPVRKKKVKPVETAQPAEAPVRKKKVKPVDTVQPAEAPVKKRRPRPETVKPEFKPNTTFVPPVMDTAKSLYRKDYLDKTVDSSRNFNSVNNVAHKIHTENSTRRQAPKAELQNMDKFWAELEAAKRREAEERRQREIERARRQELEKARAQEAALAKLREEEAKKRRAEEEERQRALELKRQNEEAAAKWRAEEAARVRAEADKMREIQIQKAREEEARRIQMEEVAKVREAQIHQVRMEEEEKIRENLARIMNEEDQHAQIENMLEQEVARFEEEGALLKEKEEQETDPNQEIKEFYLEPLQKDPDPLDDFVFPDVPSMEEDDLTLVQEEDAEETDDDMGEEIDPTSSPKSWVRAVISKDMKEILSDDDLFDPIEDNENSKAEESDVEHYDSADEDEESDVNLFNFESNDLSDTDDLSEEEFDSLDEADEDGYVEEDDLDEEDIDDFEDEIVRPRQNKKTSSKSFVLPSLGKIMDAERPRESRRGRIEGIRIEESPELVQPEIREEVNNTSFEVSEENPEENQITDTVDVSENTSEENQVTDTVDISENVPEEDPKTETVVKNADPLASEVKTVYRRTVDHQYHYNRKLYDSMLGKIVAATLIGVMALNIIIPDKSTSVLENRELKQAPKFSLTALADGSFTGNVEEWQGDQFVGRNILRNIQIFLRWIGGDREENDVYFGKKGQLLEKIVKPDEALLQENVQALNAFAEKYPDRRYGMMLVPDAGTILTDQYPAFVEKREQRGDFGRVKSVLSEKYQWIDVLGAMDTHPDEKLYYKTDHHWTSLGAYYGYQNFCAAFGMDPGNFAANSVTSDFNGSLASMSGFCLGEKETIEIYTPDAQTKCLVSYVEEQRQTATLYDTEKLESKDQYTLFMGGNYPLIDIKTTTDNDQVLMLVKDSFANSMIPFLATQYKEIIVVDPRYYYGDAEELLLTYGVSDVLFLYSGNTFFADNNLQGFLV